MENNNLADIGKRIKEQRKKNNLTQEELAALLMVSREKVNYWEVGSRDMKTGDLFSLAKALNTTSDYLLGIERGTTPETRALIDTIGLSETSVKYLSDDRNDKARQLFNFLIDGDIEAEQNDRKIFEKFKKEMEEIGLSEEQIEKHRNSSRQLSILSILCRWLDIANAADDLHIHANPDGSIELVNISINDGKKIVTDHFNTKFQTSSWGIEICHNLAFADYISECYISALCEMLRDYYRKQRETKLIY